MRGIEVAYKKALIFKFKGKENYLNADSQHEAKISNDVMVSEAKMGA